MHRGNIRLAVVIIVIVVAAGAGYFFLKKPQPAVSPTVPETPTAQTPTPPPSQPIKLGFIGPLSGDAAGYGEPMLNTQKLAIEAINTAGGIAGRNIELIIEDGKCEGKSAVTAAQKLINVDQVKIILGGSCSGETLAFAPLAEQSKVLVFSSLASSPDISKAGDYVFRNAPSDQAPGIQLAELIYKKQKKVAIVSENTEYAQAIKRVFKERFTALGGKIVADEAFQQEEKDFKTYLTKIKAAKPDAIFIDPQTGATGGFLVKQIKELGIKTPVYGVYFGTDKDFKAFAKDASEGFMYLDFVADPSKPRVAELFKKYKDAYGTDPNFPQYMVMGYDALYILKDAIEKVGEDPAKIKDHLYTIKNYDGIIGQYGFDENGDVTGIQFKAFQIKNGQPVALNE